MIYIILVYTAVYTDDLPGQWNFFFFFFFAPRAGVEWLGRRSQRGEVTDVWYHGGVWCIVSSCEGAPEILCAVSTCVNYRVNSGRPRTRGARDPSVPCAAAGLFLSLCLSLPPACCVCPGLAPHPRRRLVLRPCCALV